MKNLVISLLLLLCSFTQLIAQDWTPLDYDADAPGLENNPYKGFATMWNPNDNFPHSLQGRLFGLNEVMNGIDDFDWTVVENYLSQQASLGKHCTVQFNIDPGVGEYDADGNPISFIPDYLVDLVEWEYFETTPEFFEATNITYFNCPDWNDPDLMAAMLNFIEAFGQEYDGDERLFWVQTGLYGMWGEWHIGNVMDVRPEFAMNEANQSLIAQAFLTHFPNSNLVTRFPDNIPTPESFGYSDGLFFTESIDDTIPWYFQTALTHNNADQNWRTLPIGGEVTPEVQDTIWDLWPNQTQWSHEPNILAQDISTVLESLHPTWLFSHHVLTDVIPGTDEYDNAITTQKMLGYEFYVDKFKLTAENGHPHVEVNIQNLGLAPMYANWDVEFIAVNSANEIIDLGAAPMNLNLIQPDVLNNYRTFSSAVSLLDNEVYTIKMGVKNPLDTYSADAVQLTFANTTHDTNPTKWLTLGDMVLTNGNLGTLPVSATGVNIIEDAVELEIESSLQLTAEVLPMNSSNSELTWVSSNPNALSVDENGVITAGAQAGTVTVTAITNDGAYTDQVEITISAYKLLPAFFQAEDYFAMSGIGTETNNEAEGVNVGAIDGGDWLEYAVKVEAQSEFELDLRVAAAFGGGQISLVNPDGVEEVVHDIPNTTAWDIYQTTTTAPFILEPGEYLMRVVSNGGNFNFNWLDFRLLSVLDTPGCTDNMACNFNALATTNDGSCVYAFGCDECDGNGGVTDNPEVGETCDDLNPNTENDVYTECGICQGTSTEGCTDPDFIEFNQYAVIDNGTCETLKVFGCTYEFASNYNPAANTDDSSCILEQSCQGDFNFDGFITASDLTQFLAVFGLECD